ncbi:RNA 2',3'-cyclic phosphodiesterase [Allomeiothermus silvanus]|uniref:RNA 2',3'-cyclic phosphodiesterase n=1 Tax=Allomeiothermus silvanus TaxID=52022 RepID=UPI0023F4BEAC|nr:RNA 2',3'-cyclic phosphodiesterase [Allomeiothermus silvanus]
MRLFYAVFVPKNLCDILALAQEKVRSYSGWKVTRPDQFHVTLLFLGEVDETRLPELRRVGEEAAAGVAPFTARVRGTGFFPERGSPRVWFAKAEGAGFEPLAAGLRMALPEFAEAQSFKAHITLARRKGPAPRPESVVFDLAFRVQEASLVHSELSSSGSTYQVLEQFPLAG